MARLHPPTEEEIALHEALSSEANKFYSPEKDVRIIIDVTKCSLADMLK